MRTFTTTRMEMSSSAFGLLHIVCRMTMFVMVEGHAHPHRHQRHPIPIPFLPGPSKRLDRVASLPSPELSSSGLLSSPKPNRILRHPAVTFNSPNPVTLTYPRSSEDSEHRGDIYRRKHDVGLGVTQKSHWLGSQWPLPTFPRPFTAVHGKGHSSSDVRSGDIKGIQKRKRLERKKMDHLGRYTKCILERGTESINGVYKNKPTREHASGTGTLLQQELQKPPQATHSHNHGVSSALVQLVTVHSLDSDSSMVKPVGYKVAKVGKPGDITSGRTKPLLDHFHGLHFGIMDPAQFPQRPPVKASYSVEGTLLWAVGLFGTVENGAVLLTTLCSKKFKKPLHMLIGSLAMTDLFVSLIYIPSYTYYLLEGDRVIEDPTGEHQRQALMREVQEPKVDDSTFSFCRFSRSIFVEIASVTLTLKALIAVYLYVSACSREKVAVIFSTRNTSLYITMAWFMNFAMLFIPKFLGYPEVDFYPNSFICEEENSAVVQNSYSHGTSSAVYTFVTLTVHIFEILIVCLCFVKVHLAIVRGKVYSEKHRSADKQAKINYLRALKITCLVFVSFCICWMPIYIINILDPSHSTLPDDVHHLVMDLLLLKSSVNPTIYIYGIRSLRYEIKLLCLCRCRKDNNKEFLLGRHGDTSSGDEGRTKTFSTMSGKVYHKAYRNTNAKSKPPEDV